MGILGAGGTMKKKACIIGALVTSTLQATSLVYNLKIRRTFTGIQAFLKQDKKTVWVASGVPITYYRTAHIQNETLKTDIRTKRFGGGAILNLRCIPSKYWWAEATTAVHKEHLRSCGSRHLCASRGGFDDVVLATGRNWFYKDDLQLGLYGLAGFPTTWKASSFDAQEGLVGTRFYALGGGGELSYSFISTEQKTFAGILQIRAIHFFNREWETILGPGGEIQPGNIIDTLFALRYRYKRTVLETGYNATIFANQAVSTPQRRIESKTGLRNGVYVSGMHLLEHASFGGKPVAIGGGFQFNRVGRLDANSYLAWANITVIF